MQCFGGPVKGPFWNSAPLDFWVIELDAYGRAKGVKLPPSIRDDRIEYIKRYEQHHCKGDLAPNHSKAADGA